MRTAIALFALGCALPDVAPERPPTARPAAPAELSGWILVDQPDHAGYEASLYEFRDDGSIVLDSSHVSYGGAYEERDESVATVTAGDVHCTFGGRYARGASSRVAIDGTCSDGRPRSILLETTPADAVTHRFAVAIVSVGGESGWTNGPHTWSFRRCGSREECLDFLPPAQRARGPCAALDIRIVPMDGRINLWVHGARFLMRAIPVVGTVGGRPIEGLVVSEDGSIAGLLPTMPRSGELLVLGYADAAPEHSCPIP